MSLPPEVRVCLQHILDSAGADDRLQAEAVWTAAKPTASPLHPYITWDTTKAAYEYQLMECRQLIHRCVVRLEGPGQREIKVHGFVKTATEIAGYVPFQRLAEDPVLQQEAVARYDQELAALNLRYARQGNPALNHRIRAVCRALKVEPPTLFDVGAMAVAV
jgi:hypothetical protein